MRLPLEVVIRIIQDACVDDFGKTARRIGLVSKTLRTITEPLELRAVIIIGIKQLEGFTTKLKNVRARTSGAGEEGTARKVEVQHLFLSEITERDALDLEVPGDVPIGGEMMSIARLKGMKELTCNYFGFIDDWGKLRKPYCTDSNRFWSLATDLLKTTGPTLKSLSVLTCDCWFEDRRADSKEDREVHYRRLLGCLSGMSFPNLIYLAVEHDAQEEINALKDEESRFRPINTPRLRSLHIRSTELDLWIPKNDDDGDDATGFDHPLLRTLPAELVDLTITGRSAVEEFMKGMYGYKWREHEGELTLPGKLQSVVLREDFLPDPRMMVPPWNEFDTERERCMNELHKVIKDVEKYHIDGLEMRLPYWSHVPDGLSFQRFGWFFEPYWTRFPAEEQKHFEALLKEFKKEVQKYITPSVD